MANQKILVYRDKFSGDGNAQGESKAKYKSGKGIVTTSHVKRDMKIFGITKTEIDQIGFVDNLTTFSFFVAGVFYSLASESYFSSFKWKTKTFILCSLVGFCFSFLGLYSMRRKNSIVENIMEESKSE